MAAKRFLMAGLTLILAMSAYAQQGSTGSITGTVADPSGQVVPKATVKVTSELNASRTRPRRTNRATSFSEQSCRARTRYGWKRPDSGR